MPIFSRNTSRNGNHIRFSIYSFFLSCSPPPLFVFLNALFSNRSPRLSKLYPRARLFTFTLWARLTFCSHRRATSSRTFVRLSPSIPPLLSLVQCREHSHSRYIKFSVCMQITSWRIFSRLPVLRNVIFPQIHLSPSFLPSFLPLCQYLQSTKFQPTLSRSLTKREQATSWNYFTSKSWIEMFLLQAEHHLTARINLYSFHLSVITRLNIYGYKN